MLPLQGWDPLLLSMQIIAFQATHYLALGLLTPVLLYVFAAGPDLDREGGPSNVAMVVDWREMVGRNTVPSLLDNDWTFAYGTRARSVVLSFAWIFVSLVEIIFLYQIIRKPTHILDFSLTLIFIHFLITSYYASAFPTSLYYWAVLGVSALVQIVWAEQLCIKREMRDGLGVNWKPYDAQREEQQQNSNPPQSRGSQLLATLASLPARAAHEMQSSRPGMLGRRNSAPDVIPLSDVRAKNTPALASSTMESPFESPVASTSKVHSPLAT